LVREPVRKEIRIPEIPGYRVMKCDFHLHTVFSDGTVWPENRVNEAWEEGLDAIAITDHIENQPSKRHVGGDHNSSYEIALAAAREKNIILVRGGEITRKMPPGHLNAIFLTNVNLLDVSDPVKALEAAKKQGAFIFWNHPGWKEQQPDTCKWMPMHQMLSDKGLINGIEVFNEKEYYPVVLEWCLSRNLTIICNSDIHDVTAKVYDLDKGHRPMTLAFVKKRDAESLREALFQNRTLAFFNNKLAGKEELLKALFTASVSIRPTGILNSDKIELIEFKNISSVPFDIETKSGTAFSIPAESTILFAPDPDESKEIHVTNLFTGPLSNLHLKLYCW
jgi:hypothetical protein